MADQNSSDDQKVLLVIQYVTLGMSFLTTSYIIGFYLLCKSVRNFATRLIFFLCVATLGNITTILVSFIFQGIQDDPDLCTSTAFFENCFALSAVYWALTISYVVHYQMKEQKDIYDLQKIKKGFIFIVPTVLPILFSLIPVFTNQYGKQVFNSTGYYCWIKMYSNQFTQKGLLIPIIIQIVSYYGPYILAIVINLILTIRVYQIPSEYQIWQLFERLLPSERDRLHSSLGPLDTKEAPQQSLQHNHHDMSKSSINIGHQNRISSNEPLYQQDPNESSVDEDIKNIIFDENT